MKKYTNYRVVITEPAFPNGEYVVTRRSLHSDYTHVGIAWSYKAIDRWRDDDQWRPYITFSRSQSQAWKSIKAYGDSGDAVRIVQEIQQADKS